MKEKSKEEGFRNKGILSKTQGTMDGIVIQKNGVIRTNRQSRSKKLISILVELRTFATSFHLVLTKKTYHHG